ncbi:hypothetical protein IWQ60_005152 [Tieghemiomyces parasiticus]|uniref:Uncharacterized protein n=1 Tax=Tieghemiomyces parasiticus TaxID=78921 RepID=A0A9W8A6U6_9FUNG|nr:hypothetical protein IWQ60_005152 [Tieghemiomyces parasiticus]
MLFKKSQSSQHLSESDQDMDNEDHVIDPLASEHPVAPPVHYVYHGPKLTSTKLYIGHDKDSPEFVMSIPGFFKYHQFQRCNPDGSIPEDSPILWRRPMKMFKFYLENPVDGTRVDMQSGKFFSRWHFQFVYCSQPYAWRRTKWSHSKWECMRVDNDMKPVGPRVAYFTRKYFSRVQGTIDLHIDETWAEGFKEFLLYSAMIVIQEVESREAARH